MFDRSQITAMLVVSNIVTISADLILRVDLFLHNTIVPLKFHPKLLCARLLFVPAVLDCTIPRFLAAVLLVNNDFYLVFLFHFYMNKLFLIPFDDSLKTLFLT